MKKYLFIFVIVSLLFSCKKDEPIVLQDVGYDYFPTGLGHFVTYACDSIVFPDIGTNTETYKFKIKEVIDSAFTDNSGRPAVRIARYKKWVQYDTLPVTDTTWHLQDIWWANLTNTTAEVVEENTRFIKLAFPVELNKVWDGNAQNSLGKTDYEYTSVDEPLNLGGTNYEKTLNVNQSNDINNLLYYKKDDEKYAKGVGMIFKELKDYTWEQDNGNILVGTIKYGLWYKMTAIAHGTE
jgi:hypothetical protein